MVKSVVLPASWHQEQLKDLCLYPGEYGLNSPAIPLSPDLPLYIRITDIDDDGRYLLQHRATVIYSGKQKLLQKNDLLFARTGATVGKTYLHQDTSYPTAFAGYLIRFVPNTAKTIPYFLFLYCHTAYYWNWIKIFKARSGQPGISADEYGKMLVPCPPIAEQQKIVEVLETWDKAITLTKQLIEQKELQKKYLMQQLLTGRTRLKGFSNKWGNYKLQELAKIHKGKQLNSTELTATGEYPCLNGGITPSGYTHNWNSEKNTISISEGGNSCGYVNWNPKRFWAGGHCYTLSELKADPEFLYFLLKYKEKYIMSLRVGSGLPNIQRNSLENLILYVPNNREEQSRIGRLLVGVDLGGELLQKRLAQLEEQKKGLMQVLLTGKIRLAVKENK